MYQFTLCLDHDAVVHVCSIWSNKAVYCITVAHVLWGSVAFRAYRIPANCSDLGGTVPIFEIKSVQKSERSDFQSCEWKNKKVKKKKKMKNTPAPSRGTLVVVRECVVWFLRNH